MAMPNPLRPIIQRLTTTPTEDLPRYAGYLAGSILSCRDVLEAADGQKGDASVQVHRLKTRVASLVQDKTPEGRFTGIVLTKAIVEAGGVQVLSSSGVSVRHLLSCLNKQDAPQVKQLCIITITRILLLTREHASLVREITTPTLPSFITTCLGLIRPLATIKGSIEQNVLNPLLLPVLQCFHRLLGAFASTFRPFLQSLRVITLGLTSEVTTPSQVRAVAADLFVTLHRCATKGTASSEWLQTCQKLIDATHQTADALFRSVIEDWTPSAPRQYSNISGKLTTEVRLRDIDAIGMGKWSGVTAGCARIVQLLKLLSCMINSVHEQAVNMPLASVLELTARLTSVVPPAANFSMRHNQEITRDEREELWVALPYIHKSSVELFAALVEACGQLLSPVLRILFSQVCGVFQASPDHVQLRESVFSTSMVLLSLNTFDCSVGDSNDTAALASACCNDLRASLPPSSSQLQMNGDPSAARSASFTLTSRQDSSSTMKQYARIQPKLYQAAWNLLPAILIHASTVLSSGVRVEIDSTAILTEHHQAMLASVLHPPINRKRPSNGPSILPFLARVGSDSPDIEALLRPRMPVITTHHKSDETLMETEDEMENGSIREDTEIGDDELQAAATDQLEGHLAQQASANPSAPAKRDWATLNDVHLSTDQTIQDQDSPKRLRIGHPTLDATDKSTHVAASPLRHSPASVDSSRDIIEGRHEVADAASDAANVIENSLPLSDQAGKLRTASEGVFQPSQSHVLDVDDSDDEEIPSIDATMTSDEDEEEDESVAE